MTRRNLWPRSLSSIKTRLAGIDFDSRRHGQIVAVGEAYESKTAAIQGIESVKRSAEHAVVADLTK